MTWNWCEQFPFVLWQWKYFICLLHEKLFYLLYFSWSFFCSFWLIVYLLLSFGGVLDYCLKLEIVQIHILFFFFELLLKNMPFYPVFNLILKLTWPFALFPFFLIFLKIQIIEGLINKVLYIEKVDLFNLRVNKLSKLKE